MRKETVAMFAGQRGMHLIFSQSHEQVEFRASEVEERGV